MFKIEIFMDRELVLVGELKPPQEFISKHQDRYNLGVLTKNIQDMVYEIAFKSELAINTNTPYRCHVTQVGE